MPLAHHATSTEENRNRWIGQPIGAIAYSFRSGLLIMGRPSRTRKCGKKARKIRWCKVPRDSWVYLMMLEEARAISVRESFVK